MGRLLEMETCATDGKECRRGRPRLGARKRLGWTIRNSTSATTSSLVLSTQLKQRRVHSTSLSSIKIKPLATTRTSKVRFCQWIFLVSKFSRLVPQLRGLRLRHRKYLRHGKYEPDNWHFWVESNKWYDPVAMHVDFGNV